MKYVVILGVLLALGGLVVGYLAFANIPLVNQRYSIEALLQPAGSELGRLVQDLAGLRSARRDILLSGGVGLVAGVVLGAVVGRRRR